MLDACRRCFAAMFNDRAVKDRGAHQRIPVLVRISDFKVHEYAGLVGGAAIEPTEDDRLPGSRAHAATTTRGTVARRVGASLVMCSEAPSSYPEFAAFPVGDGIDSIDSISLSPERVLKTIPIIVEAEKALRG